MSRLYSMFTVAALLVGVSVTAEAGAPSRSPDRPTPKISTRLDNAARREVARPGDAETGGKQKLSNAFLRRPQADLQPLLVKRASRSDAIFVHADQFHAAGGNLSSLLPAHGSPAAKTASGRKLEITAKSVVLTEPDGRQQIIARDASTDAAITSLDRDKLRARFGETVAALDLGQTYPSLLTWSGQSFTLKRTTMGFVPIRSGGGHADAHKWLGRPMPTLQLAAQPRRGAL